MSWGKASVTHRASLTLTLTGIVSAALAVAFVLIFVVVSQAALTRRLDELQNDVTRMSREWLADQNYDEEQADLPFDNLAIFDDRGHLVRGSERRPVGFMVGRAQYGSTLVAGFSKGGYTVVASTSWAETQEGLKQLAWVLALLWAPLSAVTALAAWWGGGLVLKPVRELVGSAGRISGSKGDDLLETSDHAEFASLTASLNDLIERVRHAGRLQEQFAADAAHEFRSPLALLRTRIEGTLLRARSDEEYRTALKAQLAGVDRLTSLVETLLASARQSYQPAPLLPLMGEVEEVARDWSASSGWPSASLVLDLEPVSARITAEELSIVLRNALDNAARYSPAGGLLTVSLTASGLLAVQDEGPGLSSDAASHAFDRLYRPDESRHRGHGGAGIGLSVIKKIVENRGGSVGFGESAVGARLEIRLVVE